MASWVVLTRDRSIPAKAIVAGPRNRNAFSDKTSEIQGRLARLGHVGLDVPYRADRLAGSLDLIRKFGFVSLISEPRLMQIVSVLTKKVSQSIKLRTRKSKRQKKGKDEQSRG